MPFTKNYPAFRSATFGGPSGGVFIDFLGDFYDGATFVWAFSLTPGAAAQFTLSAASPGSQGVSASYDPDMVDPISGAVVGGVRLVPRIDEATFESLTYDGTKNLELVHTLYATPAGGSKHVICDGILTIKQGAPN